MDFKEYSQVIEDFNKLDCLIGWANCKLNQLRKDMGIIRNPYDWSYSCIEYVTSAGVDVFYDDSYGTQRSVPVPIEALLGTEQERSDFIFSLLEPIRKKEASILTQTSEQAKERRRLKYQELKQEFGGEDNE